LVSGERTIPLPSTCDKLPNVDEMGMGGREKIAAFTSYSFLEVGTSERGGGTETN